MTPESTSGLLDEIRDLQQYFTKAQTELRVGNIISMDGIDKRIARVCQEAQKAPPGEQQTCLPELMMLIQLLTSYEKDLRTIQAQLTTPAAQGKSDDSGT
jgi:hypothetical protein